MKRKYVDAAVSQIANRFLADMREEAERRRVNLPRRPQLKVKKAGAR